AASDVFATCALCEEGLSHTIIEAQAFGKPVVAFDIPAHREIVKNGETGILVKDVGNKEDFASALTELLTNPTKINTMGENAALWAEKLGGKAINDFNTLLKEQ
ncbi:MAG: glycosyltransferase family 4 protein, partial [Dehalococcoidales bacterium]|nr:glycosyltransferase family 4 protein [Dehalococcoidales bacterium]